MGALPSFTLTPAYMCVCVHAVREEWMEGARREKKDTSTLPFPQNFPSNNYLSCFWKEEENEEEEGGRRRRGAGGPHPFPIPARAGKDKKRSGSCWFGKLCEAPRPGWNFTGKKILNRLFHLLLRLRQLLYPLLLPSPPKNRFRPKIPDFSGSFYTNFAKKGKFFWGRRRSEGGRTLNHLKASEALGG